MWVAWFSPSLKRSRITAHEASFEIVDSIPCFLKSPSSCAMTIEAQSVSAMIPILILGVSGPSPAYTPPAQPAGRPARSAPAPVSFTNSRRVTVIRPPERKMAPCLEPRHKRHRLGVRASAVDSRRRREGAAAVPAAGRAPPRQAGEGLSGRVPRSWAGSDCAGRRQGAGGGLLCAALATASPGAGRRHPGTISPIVSLIGLREGVARAPASSLAADEDASSDESQDVAQSRVLRALRKRRVARGRALALEAIEQAA